GLEVVEVLLPRLRLDDRQGFDARIALEQADRKLAPLDVTLEQDAIVVAEGGDQRLRHVAGITGELDAERRTLCGRLHHHREAEPFLDRGQRLPGAQLLERDLAEREEL